MRRLLILIAAVPAIAGCGSSTGTEASAACFDLETKFNTAEAGRHESGVLGKQYGEWSSARREAEEGIRAHHCEEPQAMKEAKDAEENTGGATH